MSSLSLHASTSLQPTLSPRLQRAVRLLQMSSQDFAQVVRDALDTNPFLEPEETAPAADSGDAADRDAIAEPAVEGPGEGWGVDGVNRMRNIENDGGVFDTLEARTSLADHLLGQLNVMPLPERDRMLAAIVVESLDDDGYLRTAPEELAGVLNLMPEAQPEEWSIALCRVQALDPAGVGARSVAECLELQLPAIPDPATRILAAGILGHIDVLAARDMRSLARHIGADQAAVEAACAAIR